MKTLDEYLKMPYRMEIVPDLDEGGFVASYPELPGCLSAGKTIEDAAKNLLKLASTIDTDKIGEPSFLMVLTAGQFAYRRKDGVYVVPIGCLKP